MNTTSTFQHIKTLEEFEGDLLSHIQVDGKNFIKLWVDVIDKNAPWTNIWLVNETSPEAIAKYLAQEIDLCTLMTTTATFHLITQKGCDVTKVDICSRANLPKIYLPKVGTLHSQDLSPEAS